MEVTTDGARECTRLLYTRCVQSDTGGPTQASCGPTPDNSPRGPSLGDSPFGL
jgi:hypothetical protein